MYICIMLMYFHDGNYSMLVTIMEFLIDNLFVSFGGTLFQQVVGIPMGMNCVPLLADLFLYSYESGFYLSTILDFQNFFHWYILQSWKLKKPHIQLRPHHLWTYTSNLMTVVNLVLKFMINGTTSISKS
jgi:hypothetical protein